MVGDVFQVGFCKCAFFLEKCINTLLKFFNFFSGRIQYLSPWQLEMRMQWMLLSLCFFHLKQISKSKATEQGCGGSPCVSVLTDAKCNPKVREEQFILPGDFSALLLTVTDLTGRWHTLDHSSVTHGVRRHLERPKHSKIPATQLEQFKSCFLFCWLVFVHGRTQSSRWLQLWAACSVRVSLLGECLVLFSRINSPETSPRFFQHSGEPLQTGTLSWPEPFTPFECMVLAKEKVLAMLEGHLFQSIYPNFLKH